MHTDFCSAEISLRVWFTSKILIQLSQDTRSKTCHEWLRLYYPSNPQYLSNRTDGIWWQFRVVHLWGQTKESCSRGNQMSYSLPLSVSLPLSLTLPSLPPGLLSITQTFNHPSALWTCPYITPGAGWQCQL